MKKIVLSKDDLSKFSKEIGEVLEKKSLKSISGGTYFKYADVAYPNTTYVNVPVELP